MLTAPVPKLETRARTLIVFFLDPVVRVIFSALLLNSVFFYHNHSNSCLLPLNYRRIRKEFYFSNASCSFQYLFFFNISRVYSVLVKRPMQIYNASTRSDATYCTINNGTLNYLNLLFKHDLTILICEKN